MFSYSGYDEQRTIQINVEDIPDVNKTTQAPKKLPAISFDELMKIDVSLKSETLPTIESLVSEAGNMQAAPMLKSDTLRSQKFSSSEEVTLPLRDVIGVVLLVASLEGNQTEDDDEEDTPSEDSTSAPIVDPKESVPLLRSIFLNDEKQKLSREKETIKNAYFESALSHYLEECEDAASDNVSEDGTNNLRRSKKNNYLV